MQKNLILEEVKLSETLTLVYDPEVENYVPKPKPAPGKQAPPLLLVETPDDLETVRLEREVVTDGKQSFGRIKEVKEKRPTLEAVNLELERIKTVTTFYQALRVVAWLGVGASGWLFIVLIDAISQTFYATVGPAISQAAAFSLNVLTTIAIIAAGGLVLLYVVVYGFRRICSTRAVMPPEYGNRESSPTQVINMNFNAGSGQSAFNTDAQHIVNR